MDTPNAPKTIVVEVSGGVVCDVYTSSPETVKVILLDHDNMKVGDEPGVIEASRLVDLDKDSKAAIKAAGITFH